MDDKFGPGTPARSMIYGKDTSLHSKLMMRGINTGTRVDYS